MFDRLSGESHRALEEARAEAGRLGHDFVGTEHLLLGVLCVGDQAAGALLGRRGVVGETVRAHVARAGALQQAPTGLPPLSLTARAKQVMALASREADDLGSSTVAPAHLLLGIIRQGTGVAALVLQDLGVDLVGLRDDLLATIAGRPDSGGLGRGVLEQAEPAASSDGAEPDDAAATGHQDSRPAAALAAAACPRCERRLADNLVVSEIFPVGSAPAEASPGRLARRSGDPAGARLSRRVRSGDAPVVVVSCGACGYPLSLSR